MKNNLAIISQHGWKYMGYSALIALVCLFLDFDLLALMSGLFFLFVAYVFRNPEIALQRFDTATISAVADGSVIAIEELNDDEHYGYCITIDTKCLDKSILRIPADATVLSVTHTHGANLSHTSSLAPLINEIASIVLRVGENEKIKIVHLAGTSFSPIVLDLLPQQQCARGDRYGVFVHGRISLYLPKNAHISCRIAQSLRGGETSLATF